MPTRSIVSTDEEDRIVDDLVRSGRFPEANQVMREGRRLVSEDKEDENFGYPPEAPKAAIQVGLDDIGNGRYTEFASVDRLVAHLRGRTDDI